MDEYFSSLKTKICRFHEERARNSFRSGPGPKANGESATEDQG